MIDGVEEKINRFKEELSVLSSIQIVRKHIIFGECCELSRRDYFNLRSEVAKKFGLHPNEVFVVGSAKLGFSLAPKNRYRAFCDDSDIDIALVSSTLFEKYWRQAYDFQDNVPYWRDYWEEYDEFIEFLFYGWIRPDKFPDSEYFPLRKDWWDFFSEYYE